MGLWRSPPAQAEFPDFTFSASTLQFLRPVAMNRRDLVQTRDKMDFTMAIDIEEPQLIVRSGSPPAADRGTLASQKIIQILLRAAGNESHQAGSEIEINTANSVETLALGRKIDQAQVRRQKNQHKQGKPN
jgi:hypothetical protein